MFNVVGEKRKISNDSEKSKDIEKLIDVAIIIRPNIQGKKVDKKFRTPVSDINQRIRTRVRSLNSAKATVSEITFNNFSIDALHIIQKKYEDYKRIEDIFKIFSKDFYDPACIILEDIPSEKDLDFFVNGLIARLEFTKNFNLLVLRNFNQNHLKFLCKVKFPNRLNLRIEHSDIEILEKLKTIKLSAEKVEFSVFIAKTPKRKLNNNAKTRAASTSLNEQAQENAINTMEELSASESDHDVNRQNMTANNGEKDLNKTFPESSIMATTSVSPISPLQNTSLSNQPGINATSATKDSNALLDILTVIKTLLSDFEIRQPSSSHTSPSLIELIKFLFDNELAEAEYHQNVKDLKNQIDALSRELKLKTVDQEQARALQDEITILKEDNVNLKTELAAIASGDQFTLVQYVLEVSQLREKNQQQIREIEALKIKLSEQESNNKRKRDEEENHTGYKVRRVEVQHVYNNNIPQNSPQAPHKHSKPKLHGPQFFDSPLINIQQRTNSSQIQESTSNSCQVAKK